MANVLLIGGGTQGLAIIRSLHKNGHRIIMTSSEQHNYGEDSRYVSKKYINGDIETESEDFLTYILDVIRKEQIDVIIPMGDLSALFISKNKDILSKKVKIKAPTIESFNNAYDKRKLMNLCHQNDYPHPETIDMDEVDINEDERLQSFHYPAMLKPNLTTGGRGMVKIESYSELKEKYPSLHEQYGIYHLQRFIPSGGKQVKVQLYVDEKCQLLASSVMQKLRWYPNDAGSSCCAMSINNPEVVELCHKVLKDLHWIGFADFDLIEDPDTNELLIMEINPRIPACIKTAIAAGVDWAEVIVNDCLGLPQKKYGYKEGEYLRHLGFDILWFKNAKDRWHTNPSWFKFFGSHIHYQDMSGLTDPLPFLLGTWHNIKKLFSSDFKQAKGI